MRMSNAEESEDGAALFEDGTILTRTADICSDWLSRHRMSGSNSATVLPHPISEASLTKNTVARRLGAH